MSTPTKIHAHDWHPIVPEDSRIPPYYAQCDHCDCGAMRVRPLTDANFARPSAAKDFSTS